MARKYSRGNHAYYQGERYVVCEGGFADDSGHFMYKIMRGSRILFVRGDMLED